MTETLELVPRQWKVVQHVREKLSCRSCESITQPPAPSHPISRGRAGPMLLAHVLFSKYCLHLPLNRTVGLRACSRVSPGSVSAKVQAALRDAWPAALGDKFGKVGLSVVTQKIHMYIASKTAHLPGSIILVRGFLFFGWMVAFLCAMAVIGLIPTVPIFVIAYMRLEGPEKWRHAVSMATVMTTLIYVVFDQLLNIPWPPTLLGTSFPGLKFIPSV